MASAFGFGFTKGDFKRDCEGLIREFFTHGVLDDVEDSLRELLVRPVHAAPTRLGAIGGRTARALGRKAGRLVVMARGASGT